MEKVNMRINMYYNVGKGIIPRYFVAMNSLPFVKKNSPHGMISLHDMVVVYAME